MTDDRSKMRDGDMPLLDRIESAMRRVTSCQGQMRVPVEATDPDIVLLDCKREIERLRGALTKANTQAEHFERHWYLRGDEVERLRKELAEVGKDAARYRWLRYQHQIFDPLCSLVWKKDGDRNSSEWVNTAVLDADIDDAMCKEGDHAR